MRMKAEAAAGIWLDGRETSRGESRHRAPAARTENGKKRQMVRRKKPFTTQNSGGDNYLCFALLRCFHFKIKYGRKVKFRASYTLLIICPSLALFRPHLKVSVVDMLSALPKVLRAILGQMGKPNTSIWSEHNRLLLMRSFRCHPKFVIYSLEIPAELEIINYKWRATISESLCNISKINSYEMGFPGDKTTCVNPI